MIAVGVLGRDHLLGQGELDDSAALVTIGARLMHSSIWSSTWSAQAAPVKETAMMAALMSLRNTEMSFSI